MLETFSLDGVSCADHGIKLQGPVSFSAPVRRISAITVPGRPDLHQDEGTYDNVTGVARCFCLQEGVWEAVEGVSNWLSIPGIRRLETSDDPGCFRLAIVKNGPARDFRLGRLAPFEIEFECDYRRFLLDGIFPIQYTTTPSGIANPAGQIATPLITVWGTGPGTLTIGGVTAEILELDDQIILDCDTQNAYRQLGEGGMENKNHAIYAPTFPTLNPGGNAISWTGDIDYIEIIPRWWTI